MQLLVLTCIIASFRLGYVIAILCTRNRLFRSTKRTERRLREVSNRENQLEAVSRRLFVTKNMYLDSHQHQQSACRVTEGGHLADVRVLDQGVDSICSTYIASTQIVHTEYGQKKVG
jgi:hypothetical protein